MTIHPFMLVVGLAFIHGYVRGLQYPDYDWSDAACETKTYDWCVTLGVDNRCVGVTRNMNTTWVAAQQICHSFHAGLLWIDSQRTQAIVSHELDVRNVSGDVWIGLNDRHNKTTWVWEGRNGAETHEVTYNNWATNHPRTTYNRFRNEAVLSEANGWKWVDVLSSHVGTSNIACEYDCPATTTTTPTTTTPTPPPGGEAGDDTTEESDWVHPVPVNENHTEHARQSQTGRWKTYLYITVVVLAVLTILVVATLGGIYCGKRLRTKQPSLQTMTQSSYENNHNDMVYYAAIDEVFMTNRKLPTPPAEELPAKCLPDGYLTTSDCTMAPLLGSAEGLSDTYLTLPDARSGEASKPLGAADLYAGGYLIPDVMRAEMRAQTGAPETEAAAQPADRPMHIDVSGPVGRVHENVYTSSPRSHFPPNQ